MVGQLLDYAKSISNLSGWWCNNHLENMSQWEGLSHIWKIRFTFETTNQLYYDRTNHWNHQPVIQLLQLHSSHIWLIPFDSWIPLVNLPVQPTRMVKPFWSRDPWDLFLGPILDLSQTWTMKNTAWAYDRLVGDIPWYSYNVRPPRYVCWFRFAPVTSSLSIP